MTVTDSGQAGAYITRVKIDIPQGMSLNAYNAAIMAVVEWEENDFDADRLVRRLYQIFRVNDGL